MTQENSAVWENPQGVFNNIMALQNKNNTKTQLHIPKINDLQTTLSLIMANFRECLLNMG
jgi:hypothetical protein